ncbi:ribonuclease HII [Alkalicella caledoniensis]|uniref:Ribonuclease HII n=1 Tax=Alkalicella caledoniensis TaxID=2731377 RepID=A0A7G9WCH8_ALKCA|nr:ribonuclease HII [Alkalicella caledoniensis]QNO16390.1 ribonuclease HII [Alkalicella caledoniensis]
MFEQMTIKQVENNINKMEKNYELVNALRADGRSGLVSLAGRVETQIKKMEHFYRLWCYEKEYWQQSLLVAGLDEAGRGPLAGPVVSAAVVFDNIPELFGINDSKKLSEQDRNELYGKIKEQAKYYSIGVADNTVIDKINILQATKTSMINAVKGIDASLGMLLIDGNFTIDLPLPQRPIVKGDSKVGSIGAASILAKVYRDEYMYKLHEKYPMYNFSKNKGYPTEEHLWAIRKYGPSPIHRLTFRGVKEDTYA